MDEDKLLEFLREIQLDQFSEAIIDRLHVTRLSHFIHVEDTDLEDIGMSKPEIRRLFETLKRARRKGTLLSRLRKSFRRHSDRRPVHLSSSNSSASISSTLTMRDTSPKREERKGLKCLIQESNIELEELLGRGAFGYVRKGIWENNGKKISVAVKCLKESEGDDSLQSQNEFIKEANSMSLLDHPYLVRLYGVVLTAPMMLVAELAPLGSLLTRLREEPDKFTVSTLCQFVIQIVTGMQYLELQRYVHRDLAARNILLLSYDQIKIGDFGLMRALPGDAEYYIMQPTGRVPFAWCAPECLKYRKFSHQSDVWAFGVTLLELFSHGCEPWPGLNGAQGSPRELMTSHMFFEAIFQYPCHLILEKIDEPYFERPERPLACPSVIYKIITECCWCHEGEERATFTELLRVLSKAIPQEAVAIRDYSPKDTNDLAFVIGDSITVINGGEPQLCWFGQNKRTMQIGSFPSMFVNATHDSSVCDSDPSKNGHFKSYVEKDHVNENVDVLQSSVNVSGTSPNRNKTDPLPSFPMSQNIMSNSMKHRNLCPGIEETDSASVYSRSSCSSSNSDSSSLSSTQRVSLQKRSTPSRSSVRSKTSVSSLISSGAVSAGSSYKEESDSCGRSRHNRPISSCSDYASQDESGSRRSSCTLSVNQYEEIDRRIPTSIPIPIPGSKSVRNQNNSTDNSPAESSGSIDASCSCHCRLDADDTDLQPRSRKRSQQLTRHLPTSRSIDSFSLHSSDGHDSQQCRPRNRMVSSRNDSFKEKWDIPSASPKASPKVAYSLNEAYEDMNTIRRPQATSSNYEIMATSLPANVKSSGMLHNKTVFTNETDFQNSSYENIGKICNPSNRKSYENMPLVCSDLLSRRKLSCDRQLSYPYDNHQLVKPNTPSAYENHSKIADKSLNTSQSPSFYVNCDLKTRHSSRPVAYENQTFEHREERPAATKTEDTQDKTPPLPQKKSSSLKRNTSLNDSLYENCFVVQQSETRVTLDDASNDLQVVTTTEDKVDNSSDKQSVNRNIEALENCPIAPPRRRKSARRNTYAGNIEKHQMKARANSVLLSPRWETENESYTDTAIANTLISNISTTAIDVSVTLDKEPHLKRRSYSCDERSLLLMNDTLSETLKSLLLCGSIRQMENSESTSIKTASSFPNVSSLGQVLYSGSTYKRPTNTIQTRSVFHFVSPI